MARQVLDNGDSGLEFRTKLNENFSEVYTEVGERKLIRSPAGDELLTLLGCPPESLVGKQDNLPTLGYFSFNSSTFCGWSSRIGVRQNFDAITFDLLPFNAAALPRFVRVKIRLGSSTATPVADVLVPVDGASANKEMTITAELGTLIENAGAQQVWFEYQCDGRVAVRLSSQSIANTGDDILRYTTNLSMTTDPLPSNAATPYQIFAITHRTGTANVATPFGFESAFAATGTFTGWGNVMSTNPSTFNVVQIPIYAFNATVLPTRIKLTFRTATFNGPIVASAYANVHFSGIGYRWVTFHFPEPVSLTGPVWAEIMADGRIAMPIGTVAGPASARYSTTQGVDSLTEIAVVPPTHQLWMRTLLRTESNASAELSLSLVHRIAASYSVAPTAPWAPVCSLTLPPNIYAVEGIETNIYWDGIFNSWIRPENYSVRVNCAAGRHDDRRWRIVPSTSGYGPSEVTDIANHSMTVEALYNGTLAATASTTIRVKAAATGNGASRKALFVGDSTLASGDITAQVLTQVDANPTTYALTLLGTQGAGLNKHEGHSGKTFNWLRTNVSSPFVFSGSFNFSQYLSTNGYTMSAGDSVFLLMGINDMFGHATDSAAEAAATSVGSDLAAIIANIQSAVSGIKVWVGMVIPPSHDQSAFGNNYAGSSQYRDRYNRNLGIWRQFLLTTYGASATVNLAPINCNLDTINNMQTATEPVNAQNAATVTVQSNGVHPALSGSKQVGDMLYCCLMSLES